MNWRYIHNANIAYKQGVKRARRNNKKFWNRKVRRRKFEIYNHRTYTKIAAESIYKYI